MTFLHFYYLAFIVRAELLLVSLSLRVLQVVREVLAHCQAACLRKQAFAWLPELLSRNFVLHLAFTTFCCAIVRSRQQVDAVDFTRVEVRAALVKRVLLEEIVVSI